MNRRTRICAHAQGLTIAFASTFLLTLSSCGEGNTNPSRVVRAAFVPAGYYLPFMVMESEGLLEKRGYSIRLQEFSDNAQMVSLFLNGHLDVTAQSALTIFPTEQKHPGLLKFVYGQYAASYFFIVPTDTTYASVRDFKDMSIATWSSPTAERFLRLIMRDNKLQDKEYTIAPYGARDWPIVLENGKAPVAYGFDVPAAKLVLSGKFKYFAPDIANDLTPSGKIFNGGAFISTRLLSDDTAKAHAIRDALFEALEIIRSDPGRAERAISSKLKAPLEIVEQAHFDHFTWPNEELFTVAQETLDIMRREHLVGGDFTARELFWIPTDS